MVADIVIEYLQSYVKPQLTQYDEELCQMRPHCALSLGVMLVFSTALFQNFPASHISKHAMT